MDITSNISVILNEIMNGAKVNQETLKKFNNLQQEIKKLLDNNNQFYSEVVNQFGQVEASMKSSLEEREKKFKLQLEEQEKKFKLKLEEQEKKFKVQVNKHKEEIETLNKKIDNQNIEIKRINEIQINQAFTIEGQKAKIKELNYYFNPLLILNNCDIYFF